MHLPDKVFGCDHAGGDRVAEGMQLDRLVRLQVLFAQEDIEVGVLLDRDLNVVGVLGAAAWGASQNALVRLSFAAFLHILKAPLL